MSADLSLPDAPSRRDAGKSLAERIHLPRTIGHALGCLCVGGALAQHGAPPWLWLLLGFDAVAWPHIARFLAMRSKSPASAEWRNLAIDSVLGGFWVAAMRFTVLPSVLIVTMLAMNNLVVGGTRLFARGAAAQAAGIVAGCLLLGVRVEPASSLPTVIASLPFLVVYPLTIGLVTYRLWKLLGRRKDEVARSDRLHRAMLDAMEADIVVYDAEGRLVLFNRHFADLYPELGPVLKPGARHEDVLREAVARGLVPEAAGREQAWIDERLERRDNAHRPVVRELRDGRCRRIVERRLPDGSFLVYGTDVTELMRRQRELDAARREAEQARLRLEDGIAAIPDGFAMFDADDRLTMVNQPYIELYPDSAPAIEIGATFESILRYGLSRGQFPQAQGREESWLSERMQMHRRPTGAFIQQLPGNRWVRINERPTREGGVTGVRTEVTDLVRREQELRRLNVERDNYARALQEANARLEELSDTDALTGLANRRCFDRRLAEEWHRALRHGLPLALLMIDVDYFKRYNDRYGHPAGDACLVKVAAALKRSVRRFTDMVARYGGEEFAMLLPHTDTAAAMNVARRCLSAIDEEAIVHEASPVASTVTLSIGVAALKPLAQMEGPGLLVSEADGWLYRAKEGGRHRAASAVSDAG